VNDRANGSDSNGAPMLGRALCGRREIRVKSAILGALCATFIGSSVAQALTADEVLKLKKAGVSDATIQQMLENDRLEQEQQDKNDGATAAQQEQKFANDNIGTWNTSDGRTVLSTGAANPSRDVFDPSVPGTGAAAYPMNIYPYVFPSAPMGPGAGPGAGPAPGPAPVVEAGGR